MAQRGALEERLARVEAEVASLRAEIEKLDDLPTERMSASEFASRLSGRPVSDAELIERGREISDPAALFRDAS